MSSEGRWEALGQIRGWILLFWWLFAALKPRDARMPAEWRRAAAALTAKNAFSDRWEGAWVVWRKHTPFKLLVTADRGNVPIFPTLHLVVNLERANLTRLPPHLCTRCLVLFILLRQWKLLWAPIFNEFDGRPLAGYNGLNKHTVFLASGLYWLLIFKTALELQS